MLIISSLLYQSLQGHMHRISLIIRKINYSLFPINCATSSYLSGTNFRANFDRLNRHHLTILLISFEIMLNFAQNSRFKFTDWLFYCITTPSPSFHATFHISNPECLLRFSYRLLFSCIWDPSSLCVSSFSC